MIEKLFAHLFHFDIFRIFRLVTATQSLVSDHIINVSVVCLREAGKRLANVRVQVQVRLFSDINAHFSLEHIN